MIITIKELVRKTILITGGAGYLATNIIRLLKDIDCNIIRLDRQEAFFTPVSGRAIVRDVLGDIRERDIWDKILIGVDIVLYLAAQTSVYVANENPHADLKINVLPMLNLLETCRQKKLCPIIIFSGTTTEVGLPLHQPVDETHSDNPITVYDIHKLMAESYLKYFIREGSVCGAILRLANVYGPGPRSSSADRGVLNMMVRRALNGDPLTIYGDGKFIRDYVYMEDVANAFIAAACHINKINGQHFIIGSGDGHTIADAVHLVAARVERKTVKRVQVTHVDPPTKLSPIETRNFVADTKRFTEATDWRASVSLEDGVDRTIDYYLLENKEM